MQRAINMLNYLKGEKLPTECNDAHAALRGFAKKAILRLLVIRVFREREQEKDVSRRRKEDAEDMEAGKERQERESEKKKFGLHMLGRKGKR